MAGGMAVPAHYLAACRQVADHLTGLGLVGRGEIEERLELIEARVGDLGEECRGEVERVGLAGVKVLASRHQRDFCEWLGLLVAGTFSGSDTAGIGELERAVASGESGGVRVVIANLPEGRRAADALAERLNAVVVVLENFPAMRGGRVSFDEMVRANVASLLRMAVL